MSTNKDLEKMVQQSAQMLDEAFSDVAFNMSKLMTEQELLHLNPLLPKNQLEETYRQEIAVELEKTKERIRKGPLVFLEQLPANEEEITNCFTKLSQLATLIAHDRSRFVELLHEDKTPQEMAGVSGKTIEVLYQIAKSTFEQEHYQESRDAFGFLCILNSQLYAFWVGLANSQYQLGEFEDALFAYEYAAELKPDDHTCYLLASRCYIAINSLENAIKSLEASAGILLKNTANKTLLKQVEKEIQKLTAALKAKGNV